MRKIDQADREADRLYDMVRAAKPDAEVTDAIAEALRDGAVALADARTLRARVRELGDEIVRLRGALADVRTVVAVRGSAGCTRTAQIVGAALAIDSPLGDGEAGPALPSAGAPPRPRVRDVYAEIAWARGAMPESEADEDAVDPWEWCARIEEAATHTCDALDGEDHDVTVDATYRKHLIDAATTCVAAIQTLDRAAARRSGKGGG